MTIQSVMKNPAQVCAHIVSTEPGIQSSNGPGITSHCIYQAELAHAEGWGIFHRGDRGDGSACVELQGLDDDAPGGPGFMDDLAVWEHVVIKARQGSALHLAALASVDPVERSLIRYWCSAKDLLS